MRSRAGALGLAGAALLLASCRAVMPASSTTSMADTEAQSFAAAAPTLVPSASCPFTAAQADAALGGSWTMNGTPGGGCSYAHGGWTIVASRVRAPAAAAERAQALDQVRQPCDRGSVQGIDGGFVCTQQGTVSGAVLAGSHLICAFTTVTDAGRQPAARALIGNLLAATG